MKVNFEFATAMAAGLESGKSFRAVLEYDADSKWTEVEIFKTDHGEKNEGYSGKPA